VYIVNIQSRDDEMAREVAALIGARPGHAYHHIESRYVDAPSPRAAVVAAKCPPGSWITVQDQDISGWPSVAYFRIDSLGRIRIARQ